MSRTQFGTKRWLPLLVVLAVALSVVVFSPSTARAAISRDSFESCLLEGVNSARAAAGRAPVEMARDLVDEVRDWSRWMSNNEMAHMSSSGRNDILPESTTTWGENVAWHSNENLNDCDSIHEMWMNSPGHRANILNGSFRYVAIGTHVNGSGWWATQLFFDASGYGVTCDGRFCDDDGSVHEGAIEAIAAKGITYGCNPPENDRFCPDQRVSRGAMAAFLTRALHLSGGKSFDFVDDNGSSFESAIESLAAAGITRGCNPPNNTRFCPNDYVTRGQMASFLARALDL